MATDTITDDIAPSFTVERDDDDREFFRGMLYGGVLGIFVWAALLLHMLRWFNT